MRKKKDPGQLQLTRVSNTQTNLRKKNNILKKNSQACSERAPFIWDFDTAYWMIDELASIPPEHLDHRKLTRSTVACIFKYNKLNDLEIDDLRSLVKQKLKIQKSAINAIAYDGDKQQKMTHHDMVISLIKQFKSESTWGVSIKGVNGKIYRYQNNRWHGEKLTKYHSIVASLFNKEPRCARNADYHAISNHLYDVTEHVSFFEKAPIGIAVPSGFIQLEPVTGKITIEDHLPDHRQRHLLLADPDLKINPLSRAPMFSDFLYDTLHGESMHEQMQLLQEITGAVISGIFPRMHKVAFSKGSGRNGKGVFWRLIGKLIPPDKIAAISPFMWNKGKRQLNPTLQVSQ